MPSSSREGRVLDKSMERLRMRERTFYEYSYPTSECTVILMPEAGGRYKVLFEGENLGSYHSAEAAADDVAGGHIFMPSSGVDLGQLSIPSDLNEWQRRPVVYWAGLKPS